MRALTSSAHIIADATMVDASLQPGTAGRTMTARMDLSAGWGIVKTYAH